jgi:hypothetical protein
MIDPAALEDAQLPPGWSRSRGFLCSCIWRYGPERGWFQLVSWDMHCVSHPSDPKGA